MPCGALLAFFASLGLWTVTDEEGRVYPRSDTAASVLDVLRLGCEALGIEERCSTEIAAVAPQSRGFILTARTGETFFADRVIAATGGGTAARPGTRSVPGLHIIRSKAKTKRHP